MQLQKINDSLYSYKTELMSIEVRHDGQWTIWIETLTECHKHTEETLFEAILFSTAFWQDLMGKEFT
tara:strand:+ start:114 stop:314 length:201 start_codon:yes stop_codon:yes gene_type:complete